MGKTRDRFDSFSKLECEIMKAIPKRVNWYSNVVESFDFHGTSLHDYKIFLKTGEEVLVQIQITSYGDERSGYCRYRDIRLDLISSFNPHDDECRKQYHDYGWRWKSVKNTVDLDNFAKVCPVSKWGKLKTCDAQLFVFCIAKMSGRRATREITDIHSILLFDNNKLKENCNYFVDTYGAKINHKVKEPWGSGFVPVAETDLTLNSCLIKDKESFLKVCLGK